jgi:hypothetical protein
MSARASEGSSVGNDIRRAAEPLSEYRVLQKIASLNIRLLDSLQDYRDKKKYYFETVGKFHYEKVPAMDLTKKDVPYSKPSPPSPDSNTVEIVMKRFPKSHSTPKIFVPPGQKQLIRNACNCGFIQEVVHVKDIERSQSAPESRPPINVWRHELPDQVRAKYEHQIVGDTSDMGTDVSDWGAVGQKPAQQTPSRSLTINKDPSGKRQFVSNDKETWRKSKQEIEEEEEAAMKEKEAVMKRNKKAEKMEAGAIKTEKEDGEDVDENDEGNAKAVTA